MKSKILILYLIGMLLSLTGCYKNSTDKNKTVETVDLNDDFSYLEGTWSNTNLSPEEINELGGSYLVIEVSDDNQLSGKYVSVQETSQRIAILDFSGLNDENKYILEYNDDGFGNSGVMRIVIDKDSIGIEITDVIISEDNTSGWGLISSELKKYSDLIEDVKPIDAIETEDSSNTLENTKPGGIVLEVEENFNFSRNDLLIENHPVLSKNPLATFSEIVKASNEALEVSYTEEIFNGRLKFHKGDGIIYVTDEEDAPFCTILTSDKYAFGCGLKVQMDEKEFGKLKLPLVKYLKEEVGDYDKLLSSYYLSCKKGFLSMFDYDTVYYCEGYINEVYEGKSLSGCRSLIALVKDGTVVAISTDQPTAN